MFNGEVTCSVAYVRGMAYVLHWTGRSANYIKTDAWGIDLTDIQCLSRRSTTLRFTSFQHWLTTLWTRRLLYCSNLSHSKFSFGLQPTDRNVCSTSESFKLSRQRNPVKATKSKYTCNSTARTCTSSPMQLHSLCYHEWTTCQTLRLLCNSVILDRCCTSQIVPVAQEGLLNK